MDAHYPTAPELPDKKSDESSENSEQPMPRIAPNQAVPQLIQSTKPNSSEQSTADGTVEEDSDELNEHVEEPGDPDGLHAAEQERQWQQAHPASEITPAAVPKHKRRWTVLLVIVLVAAAAVGAYTLSRHKTAKPTPTPVVSQTHSDQPTTTPTKHYDSTTYTLGFDYPTNWTVQDTTAKLAITSPVVQLASASGARVSAHVVVSMQNQQTTILGYPASGVVAALESDKLSYKQPTGIQRAQTYLSYLSYKQPNGLDALYVTGDTGYQQGQQVPMSDIVRGNPLISITFETCPSTDCATGTPTPVTVLAADWKTTPSGKAVVALLESLTLN